jgi:hypothetical protein
VAKGQTRLDAFDDRIITSTPAACQCATAGRSLKLQLEQLEASATEDKIVAGSTELGAQRHPQETGAGAVAGSPAARARGRVSDAYAGFGDLYDAKRKPGPITGSGCWSHSPLS